MPPQLLQRQHQNLSGIVKFRATIYQGVYLHDIIESAAMSRPASASNRMIDSESDLLG